MIKIYEMLFAIINSLMVLIAWQRLGICMFGKAMEAWGYSFGWKLNLNAIAQNKADGSNRRQYWFTVYGMTETNR